jgi:hypothetical protein
MSKENYRDTNLNEKKKQATRVHKPEVVTHTCDLSIGEAEA